MRFHRSPTGHMCSKCNAEVITVSLKSPWIDDSEQECECIPGIAEDRLGARELREAKTDLLEDYRQMRGDDF